MRSFDLMEARIRSVIGRHNIMVPADKVALRLAGTVLKVNGSPSTRERLASVMTQAGAKADVVRRLKDKDSIYGR